MNIILIVGAVIFLVLSGAQFSSLVGLATRERVSGLQMIGFMIPTLFPLLLMLGALAYRYMRNSKTYPKERQYNNIEPVRKKDDDLHDTYYESALSEYESNEVDKAILARAIVLSDGDRSKEMGIYIKLRVDKLANAACRSMQLQSSRQSSRGDNEEPCKVKHCGNCGEVNALEDVSCRSCGVNI